MAENEYPTRDDYYHICIGRGADEETAGKIADGLIEARARHQAGAPGWETVTHKLPRSVRRRCIQLYSGGSLSCPAEDVEERARSGLSAVLSYGVFVGMVLAESGHLINENERNASMASMPDVWKWIESLNASEEKTDRSNDE